MPKFTFRLQSYLELKEKMEDSRKAEYGRAMADLAAKREEETRLVNERVGVTAKFRGSILQGIHPYEAKRFSDYLASLKESITMQQKIVAEAEKEVEIRRLSLVEAMRERKALGTLRDKRYEEYLEEQKSAEQKQTDEIVSYRTAKR
ncbi:MAG: flagellar export protein FliJ [Clostridiales bacterium]|jgi:flagellar FliJ protein|nr:flagellar export protein FliJ [Clostridiales bacterium]